MSFTGSQTPRSMHSGALRFGWIVLLGGLALGPSCVAAQDEGLSAAAAAAVTSGNPIVEGWYADPEGTVFGDRYWVFPTYSAPYDKQVFLDAFSSPDLVHWTKHARILDTNRVAWAHRAMWAPAVIANDGRYYLFFGANDIQGDDEVGGIGIAVADKPEGPYADYLGKPLIDAFHNGAQPIDQFVFRDSDGQHYLIYGGWRHCNIARLREDFRGFDLFRDGTTFKEITPEGYVEGPFLFQRRGKYYFMWSEGGWTGPDYSVAYAMADSPLGPFSRIGTILQQDPTVATGAGHHSVIKVPAEETYYIVYHRRPLGETDGNHRVTCIDRLTFDAEGLIRPVKITFEGVAPKPLATPSPAARADRMFEAYIGAFYFAEGTNGYFRATTDGGKTWFWERAEQMEMLLDVYERTGDGHCLTLFSNAFNGFLTDHTSDWRGNEFNDDIMWMVIACARGYQHTGNPAFREVARANFDHCYARAWSPDLGGGLWWKTDHRSKNACVNSPGAIASHLLYQVTGDTNYLARAQALYRWERAVLFDADTGAVFDSISRDGELATFSLTYNQGTFLAAANRLGRTNDARMAADYMVNQLSPNGLMPRYRQRGDGGGFNGIGARWLANCMTQRGWERRYLPYLQQNADAAWESRRRSDTLSWSRWPQRTPDGVLYSWACSSAIVVTHSVLPAATPNQEPP